MDNQRSLRQTLRRPKTDEEIFDRITPAKHSRSKSLLDVHSSRGVHQDREPSGEHDRRAQEHDSRSLGSQHSGSESDFAESDSDESLLPLLPQRLSMAPRTLQNTSDFSPASELSSAHRRDILDDYSIEPFLDETWPEQLTQWDSSVNRHARFAYDMESSSPDEKEGPREASTPKPISWSTDLSVSEKLELMDKVGEKEKRQRDEIELRYLDRVMGLLQLTPQEKAHARSLLVARQDFDREEDEMLSHYRLEMHTSFLKDPKATKKMTTEDKENLLEKHAGPIIASAHAKFNAVDSKKIDAYWKQCGLDKKSWSKHNDPKSTITPNTPKRKRKGSLGEDEFETYSKAFAAQRQNAARFESRPLISPEKDQTRFRRPDSASPDGVQHQYALEMGYTHASQRSPQTSSGLRQHVQQRSPQPAASSFPTGVSSNHGSHHHQPSHPARQINNAPSIRGVSSHDSHHQALQHTSTSTRGPSSHNSPHHHPPHPAPRQHNNPTSTSTARGARSHHDHHHPKPPTTTTTMGSSSLGPPHRLGSLSSDPIANAHLSLPQMPPGVDSIFSLDRKRREELMEREQEQGQRPRKVVRRMGGEGEGV